jgi:anti-sigma regulatory factor (Ser/Thr protein kinase)
MTAERQRFPARADALPKVAAFVERRCRALGASRAAALRLILMAEELFINIVLHGYGGDCRRTVTLVVRDAGRELELEVEDTARPFDPFKAVPAAPVKADPRESGVGGLGRLLVTAVSSRHRYERLGRGNRVTVGVPKSGRRSARKGRK